jgi:hypothetical protein
MDRIVIQGCGQSTVIVTDGACPDKSTGFL